LSRMEGGDGEVPTIEGGAEKRKELDHGEKTRPKLREERELSSNWPQTFRIN